MNKRQRCNKVWCGKSPCRQVVCVKGGRKYGMKVVAGRCVGHATEGMAGSGKCAYKR